MRARSVVCGVDFSVVSARALKTAAAIARQGRGRLLVLFVEDPMLLAASRAAGDRRASALTTAAALERFVGRALRGTPPRPAPRLAVAIGNPAKEILKVARRHRADLIVLGTRGAGNAARLLLGSTAHAVLRHARIPVLAVPS